MKTAYPHIVRNKDICNNSPIIAGTRTPVRSIVSYHRNDLTTEEFAAKLSYLSLSEIYDALAFYYDNKEAIDREIKVNGDEIYWESRVREHAK